MRILLCHEVAVGIVGKPDLWRIFALSKLTVDMAEGMEICNEQDLLVLPPHARGRFVVVQTVVNPRPDACSFRFAGHSVENHR